MCGWPRGCTWDAQGDGGSRIRCALLSDGGGGSTPAETRADPRGLKGDTRSAQGRNRRPGEGETESLDRFSRSSHSAPTSFQIRERGCHGVVRRTSGGSGLLVDDLFHGGVRTRLSSSARDLLRARLLDRYRGDLGGHGKGGRMQEGGTQRSYGAREKEGGAARLQAGRKQGYCASGNAGGPEEKRRR